jgi:hypothetical protein
MTRMARASNLALLTTVAFALAGSLATTDASELTVSKARAPEERPSLRLAPAADYEFTIEELSLNLTIFDANIVDFVGSYYFFWLTNTGTSSDTYRLIVDNVSSPALSAAVCIGTVCTPDSINHTLAPGGADTVGVNVAAFDHVVGTVDFHVYSVGNSSNQAHYTVTIYGGNTGLGVEPFAGSLEGYTLGQNTPNPVRAATTIPFALPREERVSLSLYDVAGRMVRGLTDDVLPAGPHAVTWDGRGENGRELSSGVYFYRLTTPQGTLTKNLTLTR